MMMMMTTMMVVSSCADGCQVTDIWCDHLTKLVRVVVCGQIVQDVEPYKHDKRKDVIENQCLGLFQSQSRFRSVQTLWPKSTPTFCKSISASRRIPASLSIARRWCPIQDHDSMKRSQSAQKVANQCDFLVPDFSTDVAVRWSKNVVQNATERVNILH